MIHLDTNVIIALLGGRGAKVRERFDEALMAGRAMAISVVVHHELMFGAAASERRTANEGKIADFIVAGGLSVLPLEEPDSVHAADIRAHLRGVGTPIGPYDLWIAAQARRHGATLVTANTREFERVAGLQVVDWDAG
jgi:tRNA(fMet)-specific endonuclease VapC